MSLAPHFWSRNTKIDPPNKKKDRKVRSQTLRKKAVALKRTGFQGTMTVGIELARAMGPSTLFGMNVLNAQQAKKYKNAP